MEIGLQHYSLTDLSGSSSPSVSNTRGRSPAGTLIHSTSGLSSAAWLLGGSAGAGAAASCNELISRDGSTQIICPDNRFPFHAGKSRYFHEGKWYSGDQVSELLYGIELECLDREFPTFQQIDSLAQRIVAAGVKYGWRWPYVILGHYAVAMPFGRRTDPWLLDWGGLMGRLYVTARAHDVPGL